MDKTNALCFANSAIINKADAWTAIGKDTPEAVAKFRADALAIIAKGEALPEEFFAGLPSSATGEEIARAIHAATK